MKRLARIFLALLVAASAETCTLATPVRSDATYPLHPGFPIDVEYPLWFSSPTLADLDKDGVNELLVGDGNGLVHAWKADGSAVPGFPYDTGDDRIQGPLAVGDVDKDGDLEIVAGTRATYDGGRGRVFMLGSNGAVLSGWPKSVAWNTQGAVGRCEVYSVALFDLDGDGDLEVLAGTSNNAGDYPGDNPPPIPNLYAWHHNGASVGSWPTYYSKAGIYGALAVGQFITGGGAEVVAGRDHFYLHAYAANGVPLSGWPVHTYLYGSSGTWGVDDYIEFTRYAPTLADLEGDGTTEYIIAGRVRAGEVLQDINSALLVLDADGRRHAGWGIPALGAGAPLNGDYQPQQAPVVADLDYDGDLEIIVATFDGYLRTYEHDNTVRWVYNFAQGHTLFASEAAVGDVNGDGKPEILFGTYDPTFDGAPVGLWALDVNGNVLPGYPLSIASPGLRAAPTLGELDGDGYLEIAAAGLSGHVYAWDTTTPMNRIYLTWPTGRYDNQRSAWFRWPHPYLGQTLKSTSSIAAHEDQIVTFTIDLRNTGTLLTDTLSLTDTIPVGLDYVAGSLGISPSLGMPVINGRTITWQGVIGSYSSVQARYQARVAVSSIVILSNTVTVATDRIVPFRRSALIIANGYAVYLPVVLKDWN